MALIQDPDSLTQGTEITIDPTNRTIALTVAGNLSNDGVTGLALYSFLKEEWKDDANLIKYTFPMVSITKEQFEFVAGWKPADDTTRKLIRTAGWAEYSSTNVKLREYAGIISLGNIGETDQPYFEQGAGATNTAFQGAVNEAVQIYGDADNGNFDYRATFKIFVREQGKIYAQSELSDIGVTTMTYIAYRFPLANQVDLKIAESDANIGANAPYTGITIEYFGTNQAVDIGGSNYNFTVIIDGNGASAEQIYEKVQYQLRQNSDIDSGAGTVTGKTADELLKFVGDTLVSSNGVVITNFDNNDINRMEFYDVTGTKRTYPYVSAGTLNFNVNLQNDAAAKYWMFFENAGGSTIDSGAAILVNDKDGNPITGTVGGNATISFTFDYDGNTQGSRTASTDANIVIRAIGLTTSQFVEARGTISRSTGQNFSLVASLERNYENPA